MPDRIGTCIKCNQERRISGRGLCGSCYWIARESGTLEEYPKNRDAWKNIADEAISLYQSGLTAVEVGEKLNKSDTTIRNILRKCGITRRRTGKDRIYTLSENIFDSIDNEAAAYWLGFIYADGHVRYDGLIVHLSKADEDHLIKLRDFLGSNTKLRTRKKSPTPMIRMQAYSFPMARRLKSLGIVTGRCKFELVTNNLPPNLYSHFIRGYMDGDGYISKPPTKPRIKIVGQRDILEWISSIIGEEFHLPPRKLYWARNIYTIVFNGKFIAPLVANWIYKDASIFMERKYDNFNSW